MTTLQAPATVTTYSREQAMSLLDSILENQKPTERACLVRDGLQRRIDALEEVLPKAQKGQAARLVKRATMYFNETAQLATCPPDAFISCVLRAAEMGLAIDGKLCYVVRYKDKWQVQPDYKGLIAVARRSGILADCWADVVCENDEYEAWRKGSESHLYHRKPLNGGRGDPIGAYAIFVRPDGSWRFEEMSIEDLIRIQAMAPNQRDDGPWKKHTNEMRKKTVVKRGMKYYEDDPAVSLALTVMDETDAEVVREPIPMPRAVDEPAPASNGTSPAPAKVAGKTYATEDQLAALGAEGRRLGWVQASWQDQLKVLKVRGGISKLTTEQASDLLAQMKNEPTPGQDPDQEMNAADWLMDFADRVDGADTPEAIDALSAELAGTKGLSEEQAADANRRVADKTSRLLKMKMARR